MKYINGLRGVMAAAIFLVAGGAAQAAPIFYDFDATCQSNGAFVCADLGLTDGDAVGGNISFDDTNFAPDGTIQTADVLSFDVSFGAHSISESTAAGFLFFGRLQSDAMTFRLFQFTTAEAILPARGDYFSISDGDSGTISTNGTCTSSDCGNSGADVPFALLNNTALTKVAVADPVHEPAALAVIAFGLAGIGVARRRRVHC